jgi:hypothetical protein
LFEIISCACWKCLLKLDRRVITNKKDKCFPYQNT